MKLPIHRHKGIKETTSAENSVLCSMATILYALSGLGVWVYGDTCMQSCVCALMCGGHTWQTDEKEGLRPTGDLFPWSVTKGCSLLRVGGNNTIALVSFICCHFLFFPPPSLFPLLFLLSPPETQHCTTRLPTVHHCTPVKLRLVAVGSPRFQSCRRCLDCFLSPIFHLSCFWERK